MLPDSERSTCVAIHNEIAELAILRETLKRFCADHAVARKAQNQLQVTLDEIASNVIKYAWPEGGAHELSVRMTASAQGIEIEVVDDGRPFDPVAAPQRTRLPGRRPRPGGIGIHMAKQLVDDIAYFRADGCNHVVLTKRCGGGTQPREA